MGSSVHQVGDLNKGAGVEQYYLIIFNMKEMVNSRSKHDSQWSSVHLKNYV